MNSAGSTLRLERAMIIETRMPNRMHRGKVRDTYQLNDDLLLMVATDRISAFDVVLPNGIPDKGAALNGMSAFWFGLTDHIVPNHLVALADSPGAAPYADNPVISDPAYAADDVARQAMVVKKSRTNRHRVHRSRIHHRICVGRIPTTGHRVRQGNAGWHG